MGLDNGIEIVRNEYSNNIKKLNKFTARYDKYLQHPFEVCYWRKCWNVRADILNLLMNADGDMYQAKLEIDDIKAIRKLLKSYNSKKWSYGWQGAYWKWHEHKRINRKHIRNLKKLIKVMKQYPELDVYFYDSY